MIEKAEYELDLILKQCDPNDQDEIEMQKRINNDILDIVKLFASQGHSGFSAGYSIPIIEKLLRQSFVTPLTGEDDEWIDVVSGIFQNKREGSIFKQSDRFDGKPYYLYGKKFSDDGGETWFTNEDSLVPVEFPLKELPKPEYIILETNNERQDDTISSN